MLRAARGRAPRESFRRDATSVSLVRTRGVHGPSLLGASVAELEWESGAAPT
jgi:hypothetical protein